MGAARPVSGRYIQVVGETDGGPPTVGNFVAGNVIADPDGFWFCSVSGTPGSWFPFADPSGVSTVNPTVVSGGGAYNLDASLGGIQDVSLGANAGTPTITNPRVGQILTIRFRQDGAGSRTYSWPSNCRFAANAAPTATTTASRMDAVTFVYDGTVWGEINRTLNVPVS